MSLVQGVGDEVMFFFIFMLFLIGVLIVIALRANSRNDGALANSGDRQGVVTQSSGIGYSRGDRQFEDPRTTTEGVGRAFGDSRTTSDGSRTASDSKRGVSGAASDETRGVDEDFDSLCDVARSHPRLNAATHADSGDRGEVRRRTRKKPTSADMEPSRHAENETTTGSIWEAAEVEANGQELLSSHDNNIASASAEACEIHETVPTPGPPDEDGMHISLVHFQQRIHITCRPDDTLARLAEVHFAQELGDNIRARFIYCGRLLDGEAPLRDHHLPPEAGIHIHFSNVGGIHSQTTRTDPAVLDISGLFLPLLGLVLCAVWAALLWKPALFTLLTKLMLYFLSFGYVLLLYARFGRRDANVARL